MAVERHKERLVPVQIGPRHYVKMYESEAIAKGLYKPAPKENPQPEKKAVTTSIFDGMEKDDFTEIPGVGKATDQALHEKGIHTFEQLLDCDVSYLSKQAQKAVEEWRKSL